MSDVVDFDACFEALTEGQQQLAIEQQLPYLAAKAERFLNVGAKAYRASDAFGEPRAMDLETERALQDGCRQLLACRGLDEDGPLTGLGVRGFYALMAMFHFKSVRRKTKHRFEHQGQPGKLDVITFEHVVSGMTSTLCHFCESPRRR